MILIIITIIIIIGLYDCSFSLKHFFVARKNNTFYLAVLIYSILKFGVEILQVIIFVRFSGLNIFVLIYFSSFYFILHTYMLTVQPMGLERKLTAYTFLLVSPAHG